MTIELHPLYHWSPLEARAGIIRHGLKPRTYTAIAKHPFPKSTKTGHHRTQVVDETIVTVCLGTTARTAWRYSGGIHAERGSVWDLWEVNVEYEDEVHVEPLWGDRLAEIRVANRIPKSRVWHVGTRTVGARRVFANPPMI